MLLQTVILIVHLVVTAYMTGLIWFVQLVHYPVYRWVGPDSFVSYQTMHTRRTGYAIGPAMALELITAALAPWVLASDAGSAWGVPGIGRILGIVGLGLVIGIWASTVAVQWPCHERLSNGYDPDTAKRLVATNWARTLMWTARLLIAAALLLLWIQGLGEEIQNLRDSMIQL